MATITSTASGNWGTGGTWVGGIAPVLGDSAIIAAGHTVTIDGVYRVGDDTANAVLIAGTLSWSRSVNSSLAVRGGVLHSGTAGSFDMGTAASPIPSGVTATLLLNDSATLANGEWGLTFAGANFSCYGASKTGRCLTTGASIVGATSISVDDATGWAVGDRIGIKGDIDASFSTAGVGTPLQRETRFITSISGAGPYTIGVAAMTYAHESGSRVVNLTRNVRIGCYSSTVYAGLFQIDATTTLAYSNTEMTLGCKSGFPYTRFRSSTITAEANRYVSFTGNAFHNFTLDASPGATQTTQSPGQCIAFDTSAGITLNDSVLYSSVSNIDLIWGAGGNIAAQISNCSMIGGRYFAQSSGRWVPELVSSCDIYALYSMNDANGTHAATIWRNCKFEGTEHSFNAANTSSFSHVGCTYNPCAAGGSRALLNSSSHVIMDVYAPTWNAAMTALGDNIVRRSAAQSAGMQCRLVGVNGDPTDSRIWKNNGIGDTVTDQLRRSAKTLKVRYGANSGSVVRPFEYSYTVPVTSGVAYVMKPSVRYDTTFGTTTPPSISYSGPGISVTDTAPATANTWHDLSRTVTPTSTGTLTITYSLKGGTNGAVWFDGMPDTIFVQEAVHYGYLDATTTPYLTVDAAISQTTEATVGAYTGISINHGTSTVTLTVNHTMAEIYDYAQWDRAQSPSPRRAKWITRAGNGDCTFTYNIVITNCTITGTATTTGTATFNGTAAWSGGVLTASNGTTGLLTITGAASANAAIFDNTTALVSTSTGIASPYTYGPAFGSTGTWSYRLRRYAYLEASGSFSATGETDAIESLVVDTGTAVIEATAAAYTGFSPNAGTKIVTVTAARTAQELHDYMAWWIVQTAQATVTDEFSFSSGVLQMGTWVVAFSGAGAITGSYTDANGTRSTISAPNLPTGTRVQFYDVTNATEITNAVLASPGATTSLYFTSSPTIRLRAAKLGELPIESFGVLTTSGLTFIDEFVTDDVYVAKGIDGSTVTEFTADEPNVQIDSNDPDGVSSVWRAYAWWRYYETLSLGVAGVLFGKANAVDTENLAISSTIQLDNIHATPLKMNDGYMYRTDGVTIIASASGSIQMDPKKAYGVESEDVDTGYSMARTLRIIAAAVAGKTTGGPGGFTARNLTDTADQIVGTADASGNRLPTSYGS